MNGTEDVTLNKEQMSKRQGIAFISCFAEVLDPGVLS